MLIAQTAKVQIIHNSPYPTVDIYVNDSTALAGVSYRACTGLIDLPTNTTVGIAPAGGDVIASFPFELVENGTYVVTASLGTCSATDTVVVGEPTAIVISGVVTNASVNGASDGAIDMSASGGNPCGGSGGVAWSYGQIGTGTATAALRLWQTCLLYTSDAADE